VTDGVAMATQLVVAVQVHSPEMGDWVPFDPSTMH
jgi:hypothetical protein